MDDTQHTPVMPIWIKSFLRSSVEIFDYYKFYEGQDSVGSNGFHTYVGQQRAMDLGILNLTMDRDFMVRYFGTTRRQLRNGTESTMSSTISTSSLNMTDEEIEEAI